MGYTFHISESSPIQNPLSWWISDPVQSKSAWTGLDYESSGLIQSIPYSDCDARGSTYIVRSISFDTFSPEALILLKPNRNFSRSRIRISWIRCMCYSAPVTSRRPRCRALKGACSDRLSQSNYLQTSWKQHLLNLSFSFEIARKKNTCSEVWIAARRRSSLDAHLYEELRNHDELMTWHIFHDPAGLENVWLLARKCLPEAPCSPIHGIPG